MKVEYGGYWVDASAPPMALDQVTKTPALTSSARALKETPGSQTWTQRGGGHVVWSRGRQECGLPSKMGDALPYSPYRTGGILSAGVGIAG